MAKKIKIIHINDGTGSERVNENRHYVEDFPWTEKYLQQYLRDGYEIRFMVPEVDPNIQGRSGYNFFKSGYTFYLEKEVPDDELDDGEDWELPEEGITCDDLLWDEEEWE